MALVYPDFGGPHNWVDDLPYLRAAQGKKGQCVVAAEVKKP